MIRHEENLNRIHAELVEAKLQEYVGCQAWELGEGLDPTHIGYFVESIEVSDGDGVRIDLRVNQECRYSEQALGEPVVYGSGQRSRVVFGRVTKNGALHVYEATNEDTHLLLTLEPPILFLSDCE